MKHCCRWLVSGLLGVCVLVGCRGGGVPRTLPTAYTAYQSPHLLTAPPRRVLVMPVTASSYEGGYAQRWHQLLLTELKSTRQFEVVTGSLLIPCVQQCLGEVQRGQYSEGALAAVRDYYRVDGVLFVSLADFSPFWPPHMAVTVNLVEAVNGETIAAVDGNWDARDTKVVQAVHHYAQSLSTVDSLNDADIVLQSPEYFGKFVAHDIALALANMRREAGQSEDCEREQGNAGSNENAVIKPLPVQRESPDNGGPYTTGGEELPLPASEG